MPGPQDLIKLIAGGGGQKAAPPSPGAEQPGGPPQAGAPAGTPMTTPQQNEGVQQAAMVDISMAMDLLEKSLPPFGSESEEGKSLLSALSGLSKAFGEKRDKAKPLVPAELMQLMASLPQAGGASPEMKAMAGGGAPPGAGMAAAA